MADSYVCSGAMMRCTMGTALARLTVLPSRTVYLTGQPMANVSDHESMVNLAPFGQCRSMGYPETAKATAANSGILTPMPCMHNTPLPWEYGKDDYLVKGKAALLLSSTCPCMWGGTISLVNDGQIKEGNVDLGKETLEDLENTQTEEDVQVTVDDFLDALQLTLDVAGMAPGVGAVPDLINAGISALRGDWLGAGISLVAAVPGIGDAVGGAKIAHKAAKTAKATKVTKSVKATIK